MKNIFKSITYIRFYITNDNIVHIQNSLLTDSMKIKKVSSAMKKNYNILDFKNNILYTI